MFSKAELNIFLESISQRLYMEEY